VADIDEKHGTSLTGHLLIAMPAMMDSNFHQSVTYLCEHSEHGALGIVINKPLDMDLGEIFERLSLGKAAPDIAGSPVLRGGPVQIERGFIVHESMEKWEASSPVTDTIQVTTSRDILAAMASGTGPERAIIALGYAGWGAGQLEAEMTANAWLSVPASTDILFDTPFQERWREAAALLGVDLATLSTEAGHA
jgi:putative transcriptional regulator